MLNEADTRAKLIDPKLKESGWHETQIHREYLITKGRVFLIGDEPERKERKKADYLLRYSDSFPLAVLEAKDESHSPADGIQQAKGYAESLKVLFAYSSNGHGIEEFDFIANQQRSLSKFPAPDELLNRYYAHKFPEFLAKSQKAAEKPKKAYTVTAPQPSTQPPLQEDPLLNPYFKEPGRTPWYFQEIAIKNIIERILKGDKRILLTMATGTGKTFVAFQVTWKARRAR